MPASSEKSQRILAGLRRLSPHGPGQGLTSTEIARGCKCHKRAIVFIERRASYNLARKLHEECPDLLEAVFPGRPIHELLGRILSRKDPYRTGAAFVRPKREKRAVLVREVPISQLIAEVAPVRPERNFNQRRAREAALNG